MDKEPEVGMTPALSPVELNSESVSVNTSLEIGVDTKQSENLLRFTKVNGVHFKSDEKCPDLVDINSTLDSSVLAAKDGSGDQINDLHKSIIKGENKVDQTKSSCVIEDGSGDFSTAIKRQNNGWSPSKSLAEKYSHTTVSGLSPHTENNVSERMNALLTTQLHQFDSGSVSPKQLFAVRPVFDTSDPLNDDHSKPVADNNNIVSDSTTSKDLINGLRKSPPGNVSDEKNLKSLPDAHPASKSVSAEEDFSKKGLTLKQKTPSEFVTEEKNPCLDMDMSPLTSCTRDPIIGEKSSDCSVSLVQNVASQDQSSNTTSQNKSFYATSQDQSPNLTSQDQSLGVISQDQSSDATPQNPSSNVTSQDQSSSATPQDPSSNVSLQDPSSNVSLQDQSSNVTSQNKFSNATSQDQSPNLTSQEQSSDMDLNFTATGKSCENLFGKTPNDSTEQEEITPFDGIFSSLTSQSCLDIHSVEKFNGLSFGNESSKRFSENSACNSTLTKSPKKIKRNHYISAFHKVKDNLKNSFKNLSVEGKAINKHVFALQNNLVHERSSTVLDKIGIEIKHSKSSIPEKERSKDLMSINSADTSLSNEKHSHEVTSDDRTNQAKVVVANAGVIHKDIKWMKTIVDPECTDESSDEDDMFCVEKGKGGCREKNSLHQHFREEEKDGSANETNVQLPTHKENEVIERFAYGRVELGQVWVWMDAHINQLREKSMRLTNQYRDLKMQKGKIELEGLEGSLLSTRSKHQHRNVSSPSSTEGGYTIPHSPSRSRNQLHSRSPAVPDSRRSQGECSSEEGCARTRALKNLSKRRRNFIHSSQTSPSRKLDYRRIPTKTESVKASMYTYIQDHTPYQRFDGKFLDDSEHSTGEWASVHDPSFHPVLSNISDIPLDNYVNSYMSSNIGWHWFNSPRPNVNTTDKRKDVAARCPIPSSSNLQPQYDQSRLHRHRPHKIPSDRHNRSPALHDDRESRKRRYSTQSLDNKRIRTTSADSDNDRDRSGASTPTLVDHFQNQMKRKRTTDVSCLDNVVPHGTPSHKIERLKYKDIETPKWQHIDVRLQISQYSKGGDEFNDQLEAEMMEQSETAYCHRHGRYEVLEKRKYNLYMEWNRKNKKNGTNRMGSRANLPTGSQMFLNDQYYDISSLSSPASCESASADFFSVPNLSNSSFANTTAESVIPKINSGLKGQAPSSSDPPQSSHERVPSSSAPHSPCPPSETSTHEPPEMGYWESRTFPLTEEEVLQLSKPAQVLAHERQPNSSLGRFAHLGREGLKLPRVDTNTAPKYDKSHPSLTEGRRGSRNKNIRKSSSSSLKSLPKRRRKSSIRSSVYVYDDEYSADERSDSASDFDSEQTLTCSEGEQEHFIEDALAIEQFPASLGVNTKLGKHKSQDSRILKDRERKTTKHKKA